MCEYTEQAKKFLTDTNTTFHTTFLKNGFHFEGDKEKRDIYLVTLKRGSREYTFNFGQSIANSGLWYKYGVNTYPIDRKYINKTNTQLRSAVRIHYNSDFGHGADKIIRPTEPTEYDVLACLTKYDPETLEDFCANFGYDEDSKTADKVYKSVVNEYQNVCMLWNDTEIEELAEIQ